MTHRFGIRTRKKGTDELRSGTYCLPVMQGQGFHVLFLVLPVKQTKGLILMRSNRK
jgi:hypothetical protein